MVILGRRSGVVRLAVLSLAASLVAASCAGDPGSGGGEAADRVAGAPSRERIQALTSRLSGGGASFPDAVYQAINADFNGIAGRELVSYAKSGSSDGRRQLAEGTLDFAGTDSLPKPEEDFGGRSVLFFPTVAAPITIAYHLRGVDGLRLSQETLARIFDGAVTRWDDPAVQADNPGVDLPSTRIVVVHRSDGSGTTGNFTRFLAKAAPDVWTRGSGDSIEWPRGAQGAEKNSGVAAVIAQTEGAVGYVDLADTVKADLDFALVQNAAGAYVAPSAAAVRAALEGAEVADDLTYDPLDAPGADAYPITAPTWLLAFADQGDAGRAATLRTYLRYVLTTGQQQAGPNAYAALPPDLARRAIEQLGRIQP
jgi:phosphate transport system substrate-binding protein